MNERFQPATLRLALAALLLGALTLAWAHFDLPGRALVRGHLGDVAIMMLLSAVFAALAPKSRPWVWLAAAGGLGVATELAQALGVRGNGLWGELTIGATFDPCDLLAYALGLVISAAALWKTRAR